MSDASNRRGFLARGATAASLLLLSGCYRLSDQSWVRNLLAENEQLTRRVQRLFAGSHALAQEFTKADIAPVFRPNGTLDPGTDHYNRLRSGNFADYRLTVTGLVEKRLSLSLAQLREMPSRTQITRHDCVEGWSCIGEWTGTQLSHVLALAKPKENARYVVFYCMDPMANDFSDDIRTAPYYYESLDLLEATHPQTLLAYGLNGQALPVANGAPIRVRAERQLGYKQAKYVERIELVEDYTSIEGGKGGFWEDGYGYNWWGGI